MKFLAEATLHSWWVWLFGLISFGVYESISHYQKRQEIELALEIDQKRYAIEISANRQLGLQRDLLSQNDPAWIELSIMQALGVAPKDSIKVYFHPKCQS